MRQKKTTLLWDKWRLSKTQREQAAGGKRGFTFHVFNSPYALCWTTSRWRMDHPWRLEDLHKATASCHCTCVDQWQLFGAFSIYHGINKMNTVHPTVSFGLLLSSKTAAGVASRPAQRKDLSCASLTGSGLNHHPLLSRVKAKQSLLELHHQQLSHSWEGSPRSVSAEATESHTISFWSPARVSFSQSAASLVRAAFDAGKRKVKENKEVFQAWWD